MMILMCDKRMKIYDFVFLIRKRK